MTAGGWNSSIAPGGAYVLAGNNVDPFALLMDHP
jgi:hypothetical protein